MLLYTSNSEIVKFQCLKCGNCCHNLIPSNGKAGLMLFPNERNLFSKEKIRPCLGIGRSPYHRRFKTISYQLTVETCSHLKEKRCLVYEQRPLVCRICPFRIKYDRIHYSFGLAPECSFTVELINRYPSTKNLNCEINSEYVIGKEMIIKMRDFYDLKDRKARQWVYNLSTNNWDHYFQSS